MARLWHDYRLTNRAISDIIIETPRTYVHGINFYASSELKSCRSENIRYPSTDLTSVEFREGGSIMSFKPNFSITSKLADFLTQTAILREKILNLTILPKREVNLMRSARLRMVHSSTAIEGNPLSL